MLQLQSVERKYQSQISQIRQVFAQKESTLVQQVQSIRSSQASVEHVESKYKAQIQHFESQMT